MESFIAWLKPVYTPQRQRLFFDIELHSISSERQNKSRPVISWKITGDFTTALFNATNV
jgi:hypothetical protein